MRKAPPAYHPNPALKAGGFFAAIVLVFLVVSGGAPAQPSSASPSALSNGEVSRFYHLRGESLAWSGSSMAAGQAQLVRATLASAASEGLDPGRYRADRMGNAWADDATLTMALLAYMRDLAIGRPELETIDRDVALPARTFDAPTILAEALRDNRLSSMLADLAPHHAEYAALRAALVDADPARRATITANMERWRWMPQVLEPDRIVVNAATAELTLFLGNSAVLASRVIVGKPQTPTPILRTEGAAVTINPAWTVPHSIAVKEILPKLKRNRRYLAQENMILIDGPKGDPNGLGVDWRRVRAGTFPYQVQQQPGPGNALGRIKLELPNRFDVYLHDTPARNLFARSGRALSHGCVRVEQILPLATYALADPKAAGLIGQALMATDTRHLPLQRRLPVYFLYWTAFADANGIVQVVPDLYGRDDRLIAATKAQGVQVAGLSAACQRG